MNNSYLGTIFPNETERLYLAGRTELYLCGFCDHTYRFPRYNNVAKVKSCMVDALYTIHIHTTCKIKVN